MRIYLLRHGIAEEGFGKPDSERNLTADGRKKLREVLRVARAAEVSPSIILSSPYNRAVQTAQVAKEDLGYDGDILLSSAFTPMSREQDAWDEIRVHKGVEQLLVASHEPLMSGLSAFLLNAPGLHVDFKKAGMLAIDIGTLGAQPHGILAWYLTPRLAK